MNIHLECIPCFVRQGLEAAQNVTSDAGTQERIVREALRRTAELDFARTPPAMGQAIHRLVRELTGAQDPYAEAKSRSNQLVLGVLPELRGMVRKASDPMLAAAALTIAANAIDMGVACTPSEADILESLRSAPQGLGNEAWERFRHRAESAARILYVADNAGEIVADGLLIEELGPDRVTLAVRGAPVLNDATLADAREAGLLDLVKVIGNGSDAPGTILDDCDSGFRKRFAEADLIIAKGQGNFETLNSVDAPLVFLLKVKCPVIARLVGLPMGTHALLHGDEEAR